MKNNMNDYVFSDQKRIPKKHRKLMWKI